MTLETLEKANALIAIIKESNEALKAIHKLKDSSYYTKRTVSIDLVIAEYTTTAVLSTSDNTDIVDEIVNKCIKAHEERIKVAERALELI